MKYPDSDDVVVRQEPGNPSTRYLVGTASTPGQYLLRTRAEAVSQAVAFAKHQGVRAWFSRDTGFVLLGTFRADTVAPAKSS